VAAGERYSLDGQEEAHAPCTRANDNVLVNLHAESQDSRMYVRVRVINSKYRFFFLLVLLALEVLQQSDKACSPRLLSNDFSLLYHRWGCFRSCSGSASAEADGRYWAILRHLLSTLWMLLLALWLLLLLLLWCRGDGSSGFALLSPGELFGFLFLFELLGSERFLGGRRRRHR